MKILKDLPFFVSWSGGKDSCLALYRAIKEGGKPQALLTVLREDGKRTRSHGLPCSVVQAQATSLGLPLVTCSASWDNYETTFINMLHDLKKQGIDAGVFGDIDLDEHRQWVERVCSSAGIIPFEPLWQGKRKELLKEFLDAGFKATIVVVKEDLMSPEILGRTLDLELIKEFEALGIDASGEAGEYHTVVTDGAMFSRPVHFSSRGHVRKSGYRFLDIQA